MRRWDSPPATTIHTEVLPLFPLGPVPFLTDGSGWVEESGCNPADSSLLRRDSRSTISGPLLGFEDGLLGSKGLRQWGVWK